MENQLIYKEFVDAGAILKGHFLLSSGLHSDVYIQCALALKDTKRSIRLCKLLYEKIIDSIGIGIDLIVSPAMGGIIVGYEIARSFGVDFIFFERVDNKFTLKRNFTVPINAKILIVEDVITTGSSSLEVIELVESAGAEIVAEAVLINRSNNVHLIKYPIISLIEIEVNTYTMENLPECLKSVPLVRPGSKIVNRH